MTLLIDNDVVQRVLTPAMTRRALESAYRDLTVGAAISQADQNQSSLIPLNTRDGLEQM